MNVVKRNGATEEYQEEKIKNALRKAFKQCGVEDREPTINYIISELRIKDGIKIEEIQDQLEKVLMRISPEVAKEFILYRESHKHMRFIQGRVDYIDKCSKSDANTATLSEVDSNANVQNKNIVTIESEVYKKINIDIQRYRMKKKLAEMFPEVSNQYEEDLKQHIIYTHDESSRAVVCPYCVAVSMYPLLISGTSTLDGLNVTAPTNLNSFCGQFVNMIFLISAQYKGAVATSEIFNFLSYFCAKEWGEDFYKNGDKLATSSMCSKSRTIDDLIAQAFQNITFSINQPAGNRSYQSPFVNFSYFDKYYWEALFSEFVFPDGTKLNWEAVDYLQKSYMVWFNKERTKCPMAFPVETMALLSDSYDIKDKDYKEWTAKMYAQGHSFFTFISDNPSQLSSCCRLSNKIDTNTFSFTSGLTGVATGSVNVITLNMNRITQDFFKTQPEGTSIKDPKTQKLFVEYLVPIISRIHKYQIAYKTMLYDLVDAGMLPVYSAGFINLKQQYSTIGINGVNEAAEFCGLTCSDNVDYNNFCNIITGTISAENKKISTPKFKMNSEYVPAESLGVKNFNWDKEDGYKVNENRNCYNSYFYLPESDTSVLEKFRLHGRRYTSLLDGGVGCHINLEEHLTEDQYTKLIEYAVQEGTSYFTFNIPNTICKDCGHIDKHKLDKCPVCGSHNIDYLVRIVGYLRAIGNFSADRQIEASKRYYNSKI